jgi:hypothetical protein
LLKFQVVVIICKIIIKIKRIKVLKSRIIHLPCPSLLGGGTLKHRTVLIPPYKEGQGRC